MKLVLMFFISLQIFAAEQTIEAEYSRVQGTKTVSGKWFENEFFVGNMNFIVTSSDFDFPQAMWFRANRSRDSIIKNIVTPVGCEIASLSTTIVPYPQLSVLSIRIENTQEVCGDFIQELAYLNLKLKIPNLKAINSTIESGTINLHFTETIAD